MAFGVKAWKLSHGNLSTYLNYLFGSGSLALGKKKSISEYYSIFDILKLISSNALFGSDLKKKNIGGWVEAQFNLFFSYITMNRTKKYPAVNISYLLFELCLFGHKSKVSNHASIYVFKK